MNHAPDIEFYGNISNENPNGVLVVTSENGNIVVKGNIEVGGSISITATDGSFMQSYSDSWYSTGTTPSGQWNAVARITQAYKIDYPTSSIWNWTFNGILVYQNIIDRINAAIELCATRSTGQGIIASNMVFLSASILNINGTVQSGIAEYSITIPSNISEEIVDINTARSLQILLGNDPDAMNGNSCYYELGSVSGNIKAYYNADLDRIELEDVEVSGGYMSLYGKIVSTGAGTLKVLDQYGAITIVNNSTYTLMTNELNAGSGDSGILVITDLSFTDDDGNPIKTTFTRVDGEIIVTQENVGDDTPTIEVSSGREATYSPKDGWRYSWLAGMDYVVRETIVYAKSAWLGIDSFAADPDDEYDRETEVLNAISLLPGDFYYIDTDETETYTYDYTRYTTSERVLISVDFDKSCKWYGTCTYYRTEVWMTGYQDVHRHSIEADFPISILFIGQEEGSISVTSNGDVIVNGTIDNASGTVTIDAYDANTGKGGSIVVSSEVTIKATDIILDALDGIGNESPLRINLTEEELNVPIGSITATTVNGDINLYAETGSITLATISTSAGDVYIEALHNIFMDSGALSIVQGGLISLISNYSAIGTTDTPILIDTGDEDSDSFYAYGPAGVYISEYDGDLKLYQIESNGDVYVRVVNGDLLDANTNETIDARTYEQLLALWDELGLTDVTKAEQSKQETTDAYLAQYEKYWEYRNSQADPSTYDPEQIFLSANEENYYREVLGYDDAAIAALLQKRRDEYSQLYDEFSQYGDTYDEDFAIPVDTTLFDNMVWTEDQLLYSVASSLLRRTTETTPLDEEANIIGRSVTLIVSGSIGVVEEAMEIELPLTSGLTNDQKVILATAESEDIHFYEQVLDDEGKLVYVEIVDITDISKTAVLMTVDLREDVDIEATGTITIQAGNNAFIGSDDHDIKINQIVAGGEVSVKTDQGIYNAADEGEINIISGNLVLEASSESIGTGAVSVTGENGGPWTITFNTYGDFETFMSLYEDSLVDGLTITVVTNGSSSVNEVQLITYDGSSTLSFRLEYDGDYSVLLPSDASAGEVEEALNALYTIGCGVPILIDLYEGATLKASASDGIYIEEVDGDINVLNIYSESHLYLKALDGSILDGVGNDYANIAALGINLFASGQIGSAGDYLDIDLTGESVLNALADGDIYLREDAGSLYVNMVASSNGDVNLKSANAIYDGQFDGYDLTSFPAADILGNNVYLEAANLSIGMSGNDIDIDSARDVDANPSLTPVSTFSSSSYTNTHVIETVGNLYLYTVSTVDGIAYLMSPESILNGNPDGENIISGKTQLYAGGGIGTEDNPIVSNVGYLEGFSGGAQGIYLVNHGEMETGSVSEMDGVSSNGPIYITTTSPLIINESITSPLEIVLTASDSPDDVQALLNSITAIAELGGVTVTGPDGGPWTITFNSEGDMEALLSAISTGFDGEIVISTIINGADGVQEVQQVSHTGTTGALQLGYSGEYSTDIAYDSSASDYLQINPGIVVHSDTSVTLNGGDAVILPEGSVVEAGTYLIIRVDQDTTQTTTSSYSVYDQNVGLYDQNDIDPEGGRIEIFGTLNTDPNVYTDLLEGIIILGGYDADIITISPEVSLVRTTVLAGDGDEVINLIDLLPVTSVHDTVTDTVDLDGQGGSDLYTIDMTGTSSYRVNVSDTGDEADGVDRLEINGTDNADTFLLRKYYVALINYGIDNDLDGIDDVERVNYDDSINGRLRVNAYEGNDSFTVDDNSAITTLDGGQGDDSFQIGQIFDSPRDASANLDPEDWFETV